MKIRTKRVLAFVAGMISNCGWIGIIFSETSIEFNPLLLVGIVALIIGESIGIQLWL